MRTLVEMRPEDPSRAAGVDVPALQRLTQVVLASLSVEARRAAQQEQQQQQQATNASLSLQSSTDRQELPISLMPMPASLDIVEDENNDEDQQQATTTNEDRPDPRLMDAGGAPASSHLDNLAALLYHITTIVTSYAVVWQLLAEVEAARDRPEAVLEARSSQCRALQIANWEKDAVATAALCAASQELVTAYLALPGQRDRNGRSAQSLARLHVNMVLGKVEASSAAAQLLHLPEVVALRQAMETKLS
jgi:hypothetical protein